MSFSLFKASMKSFMSNQDAVGSFPNFANKLTTEYDACIRRGYQTINNIPIQTGQVPAMLGLVTSACAIAFGKTSGNHTIIDDIGKGVVAYWTGATLTPGIPPIIPATGAIANLITNSAFVTTPGTWTPVGPNIPTESIDDFLDVLISAMKVHLTTVEGIYLTTSTYPGFPLVPPAPGILSWRGFTVP